MLRRLIVAGALVVAGALAALGCGAIFDVNALGNGAAAADADDETAAVDGGVPEAAPETSNGCPSGEGPAMVRIADFCVDSVEVTRAQYQRFIDAVGTDAGGPASLPQCAFNSSLVPVDVVGVPAPPPETPAYPVHGIDWCDAKAYCLWAGKDLCGAFHSAPLIADDGVDPKISAWEKACSKDGTQRYGYSDAYDPTQKCVDGDQEVRAADGTCPAGYPGLFDMSGNVNEWIDACDPPAKGDFWCALMGGTIGADQVASCLAVDVVPGTVQWPYAGVRCCAPARK